MISVRTALSFYKLSTVGWCGLIDFDGVYICFLVRTTWKLEIPPFRDRKIPPGRNSDRGNLRPNFALFSCTGEICARIPPFYLEHVEITQKFRLFLSNRRLRTHFALFYLTGEICAHISRFSLLRGKFAHSGICAHISPFSLRQAKFVHELVSPVSL